MRIKSLLFIYCLLCSAFSFGQTNILMTNPLAEQIMQGNYVPSTYSATNVINNPQIIAAGIHNNVSPDSLKSYLLDMSTFENRNTGSDTVSTTRGIGAARRWVYSKFQDFSAANENRLIVSYLQFDKTICNAGQHRNIMAVLPGADITDPSIVLIEAHLDSRCETSCDINCDADGMEDNASGTALMMELARVMSQYTFNHTIVFMATIGEEQGLHGADALADFCVQKNIGIKAVLNNDVIGGILCGQTSSAPSCPGLNDVDSTQVRIFSSGSSYSPHKGFARFVKLEYEEELKNIVSVPMMISIMAAEDRSGRGGDHIPFRQQGFTAIRFTSANEHGDASNGPNYHDRQHTHEDILGVDTDNDNIIDSFFVDFNYLSRNAVINGNAAAMAALGPITPSLDITDIPGGDIEVTIMDPNNYGLYRIGLRSNTNDFDTVYTTTQLVNVIDIVKNGFYYISVATVDSNGVESLFSIEKREIITTTATGEIEEELPAIEQDIFLHQNKPNPFDEATVIGFDVKKNIDYNNAFIVVNDLYGKEIKRLPVELNVGVNEIVYFHGYGVQGAFIYSIVVDNKVIDSKRMIFAF